MVLPERLHRKLEDDTVTEIETGTCGRSGNDVSRFCVWLGCPCRTQNVARGQDPAEALMFEGEKRVVLYLVHLVRFYFGLLIIQISLLSTSW